MKTKLLIILITIAIASISCKRHDNNEAKCVCGNSRVAENPNDNDSIPIPCLKLQIKITDEKGTNLQGWKAKYETKDKVLSCGPTLVDKTGLVTWEILSSNMTINVFVEGAGQTFCSSYEYKHKIETEKTIVFVVKKCQQN